MIERSEITALMRGVADFMRQYVVTPLAAIATRVEAVERSLKEIPAGPPGPAGKDAVIDHDKVAALINSEVMGAVKAIPAPKDGKDIDPEVVRQLILAEVAKIPPPQDGAEGPQGIPGKDAISLDLDTVVLKVLEMVPVPKDGKDGTPGTVDYPKLVADVLQQIPTPKDGEPGRPGADADPATMRQQVLAEVEKAVAAIPRAKDGADGASGKDAPPVDIDTVVLKVLEMVPTPKDGESGPIGPQGTPGKDAPLIAIEDIATMVLAMFPVEFCAPKFRRRNDY